MHFMEIASVRARTADANTSARLAQMRRIWTPTGAMRRARLRATPWLLLLVPFALAVALMTAYALSRATIASQYLFAPAGTFYCSPTMYVSMAIILISILVGLQIGLSCANVCVWLVLQVRRAVNRSDASISRSFLHSTKQLLFIAAVFGLIGIPLSFALGSRNICFTDKEIVFRPFMLLPVSKYQMGQIESVEASCNASTKSGWGISIAIRTNDGMEFPISAVGIWQIAPLPRIMRLLHDAPFDDSRMLPGCPRNLRARLIPD
jgi:hypothetical protein